LIINGPKFERAHDWLLGAVSCKPLESASKAIAARGQKPFMSMTAKELGVSAPDVACKSVPANLKQKRGKESENQPQQR
jgi:hypothetical protein